MTDNNHDEVIDFGGGGDDNNADLENIQIQMNNDNLMNKGGPDLQKQNPSMSNQGSGANGSGIKLEGQ